MVASYSATTDSLVNCATCRAAPSRSRSTSAGLVSASLIAAANASTLSLGYVSPQDPIASGSPPRFPPITAQPHASPSMATIPNGSAQTEGSRECGGGSRLPQPPRRPRTRRTPPVDRGRTRRIAGAGCSSPARRRLLSAWGRCPVASNAPTPRAGYALLSLAPACQRKPGPWCALRRESGRNTELSYGFRITWYGRCRASPIGRLTQTFAPRRISIVRRRMSATRCEFIPSSQM